MKRGLVYTALVLAFFLVQNNFFAASSLVMTVPNLMLILVFSIGFIRGSFEGMLIGFFCGLLTDIFFDNVLGFSALIYAVMGYMIGLMGRLYYTEFVNMPLLLCLASDLLYHLLTYILAFVIRGRGAFGAYLLHIVLPELLYTGLMAVLLYPLLKRALSWTDRWEEKKARKYA